MKRRSTALAALVGLILAGAPAPALAAAPKAPGTLANPACTAQVRAARAAARTGQTEQICTWEEAGKGARKPAKAAANRAKADLARRAALAGHKAITPKALDIAGRTAHAGKAPAAAKAAAARHPDAVHAQGVLDECTAQASFDWTVDRFEACRMTYMHVLITRVVQGQVYQIGEIVLQTVMYTYTLSGPAWEYNVNFENVGEAGETSGTTLSGSLYCSGVCDVFIPGPFSGLINGSGTIVASGAIFDAPIGQNQIGFATSAVHMAVTKPNATPTTPSDLVSTRVRCDTISGPGNDGCVYPDGPPQRFFVDWGTFPDAAEHIATAQGAGAPGENIPLTRTSDPARIFSNRYEACFQLGGPPRPAGMSCDEYPFASTTQGAASAPYDGRTLSWCQIWWLPDEYSKATASWSACIINDWENTGVGNELGQFYGQYHVIDGDEFYTEIV